MKNRAILLLLGLIISSSFVFSQVSKDTLKDDYIPPQFYGIFSVEENWKIHNEAYKKQLEAIGLSEKEINEKMQEYEKQKDELIEQMKEQIKSADKQLQVAEIQRKKELQKLDKILRKQADEIRKQAESQRQKAEEHREEAEIQRQKADEIRKQAEVQRQKAEEQRKLAEEWRNSIKKLFNEDFAISNKDSKIKSIKIKVTKKNSLFFNINGNISSGNILIEIFNPNEKKEGELSLEHRKNLNPNADSRYSDKTSGSLNKTINAPETGDWLIKITPKNSNGNVIVSVAQYVKTAIDE